MNDTVDGWLSSLKALVVGGDAPSSAGAADAGVGKAAPPATTGATAASGDGPATSAAAPADGVANGGTPPLVPLQAAGAPAEEQPTLNPTSPVPTDILADTAREFVSGANAARGGGGEVGHMAASFNYNAEFDAGGKISKVNMTVQTSIVRPRWSGGRATDAQRAAIKQAEQLIKEHEERHRDIARDFATRAIKAMRGKPATEADAAFKKTMKDLDQAQKQLDAREGCIHVLDKNPAEVSVSLGPCG